jgi:hypothetical protein
MKNWRVNLAWPEDVKLDGDVEYLYEDEEGKTRSSFHEDVALAAMLLNGAINLNSNWWEDDWPKEARKGTAILVNTNDIFAWGCADAERITYEEIEQVYRYWVKDHIWGTAIWAIIREKQMPQRPVEKSIRDGGVWDLDALQKEHGLRANYYDGISHVISMKKRQAYVQWCHECCRKPLPYDGGWWAGWNEFIKANPDWNTSVWKEEEECRICVWKTENGYSE